MVLVADSTNEPVSAARKYGDWVVSREVWMLKGVRLEPMYRVTVDVKSGAFALEDSELVASPWARAPLRNERTEAPLLAHLSTCMAVADW